MVHFDICGHKDGFVQTVIIACGMLSTTITKAVKHQANNEQLEQPDVLLYS